jgi:TetR/AcrR family transcriptional regulator, transcriptional repressor for nem operon
MPYSKRHKQDTRERILESARRLFNSRGYSGVTIDEIMNDARLTHGGFYRHFKGKDELYAEAVRHFLCKKSPDPWQAREASLGMDKPRARRMVDAYLSRDHFDDRERCCPLLGMAPGSSRSAKAAYREIAETAARVFEANLTKANARERSLALLALCVGGMILARSVDDPQLADDFRLAAHKQALRTAGWSRGAKASGEAA